MKLKGLARVISYVRLKENMDMKENEYPTIIQENKNSNNISKRLNNIYIAGLLRKAI